MNRVRFANPAITDRRNATKGDYARPNLRDTFDRHPQANARFDAR